MTRLLERPALKEDLSLPPDSDCELQSSSSSLSRHRCSHEAELKPLQASRRAATLARQGRGDDEPQNSTSIELVHKPSAKKPECFRRRLRSHSKAAAVKRSSHLVGATRGGYPSVGAAQVRHSRAFQLICFSGALAAVSVVLFVALTGPSPIEARSIDDSAPPNGRIDPKPTNGADSRQVAAVTNSSEDLLKLVESSTPKTISDEALNELIERVTSAFVSPTTQQPQEKQPTSTTQQPAAVSLAENKTNPAATTASTNDEGPQRATNTKPETDASSSIATTTSTSTSTTPTTTTTSIPTTTSIAEDDEEDGSAGVGDDDNNAEDCQGLSSGPSASGEGPSDNARLVNLQTCLQKKVKTKLTSFARDSVSLFDKLSLSGACTASLLNLMSSFGELKGFAFKFLDATAKIPSGMMSGLLSDFGDFEQCLSIRSNPLVDPRDEVEERAFSGKYCLLNIKMHYKVKLGPNSTAPEGIYPDGVLWDELVRNYWTSNSSKGFQVGVCVPSRCDHDDLTQMLNLMADSYHVTAEIGACQDSNDLRRQQEPDFVQRAIICAFLAILALNVLGTSLDRCLSNSGDQLRLTKNKKTRNLAIDLLICFSIRRNWLIFLRRRGGHSIGGPTDTLDGMSPFPVIRQQQFNQSSDAQPHGQSQVESRNNACTAVELVAVESRNSATSSLFSSVPSQQSETATLPSVDSSAKLYVERFDFTEAKPIFQPLTIKIQPEPEVLLHNRSHPSQALMRQADASQEDSLSHLWGLKLLVIVWITVGHSFLYPSANNYQHYRSIINMNITRNSVWFATTNFILGIDMLLYMTGFMFVYKLAQTGSLQSRQRSAARHVGSVGPKIARLIAKKILRFWPTYLSVIALAIVIPLVSNGPMWPEMVSQRLGETCRANWWANLLVINNLLDSSRVCLPSSWFISVLMQCFLVGSGIVSLANKRSSLAAMLVATLLVCATSSVSFWLAYTNKLNAPAIRMDESFVMELDENIFKMYTSTLSNLGPFLVGMLGGFILLRSNRAARSQPQMRKGKEDNSSQSSRTSMTGRLSRLMFQLNLAFAMALLATVVLSSVFFTSYTPFWSAVYWSGHRVGWAIVTGYLIHQCATNRWRLLKDLLSLSSFIPLGRLIFIAYLVHPLFIHIHSGLVRDGLHVSLYNMMNIYITRLVLSFALALALHLFIELPFCSMEQTLLEIFVERKLSRCKRRLEKQSQKHGGVKLGGELNEDGRSGGEGERKPTHEPLLAVTTSQLVPEPCTKLELANRNQLISNE